MIESRSQGKQLLHLIASQLEIYMLNWIPDETARLEGRLAADFVPLEGTVDKAHRLTAERAWWLESRRTWHSSSDLQ